MDFSEIAEPMWYTATTCQQQPPRGYKMTGPRGSDLGLAPLDPGVLENDTEVTIWLSIRKPQLGQML